MFVVWNAAVLAALPSSFAGSDPLEVLRNSGSPLVAAGISAFSLSAIVTSFVGFVVALTDFFADVLGKESGDTKLRRKGHGLVGGIEPHFPVESEVIQRFMPEPE